MSVFRCCDELRRAVVAGQAAFNGIDYLEVVDHDEPVLAKRQHVLRVHFVNTPPPAVGLDNVVVEGGERVRNIKVADVHFDGDVLVVTVDPRGDFSPYVLRLTEADHKQPLATLDPELADIEFSFKVECASDFDCRPAPACEPPQEEAPRIDYLAKDYESFRRLMLDRMALLLPDWRERNAADLGVALVELLAYVGDHLSYQQDAIATEAYLGTARQRVSVRRHARLVDYRMHDGCNARVFVRFKVSGNVHVGEHTMLFTRLRKPDVRIIAATLDEALNQQPTVFETLHAADLRKAHNEMKFYTWQSENCCLPRGATAATLDGHFPDLKKGDLLVFQEVKGPKTGEKADADPTHRHVVRLTKDAKTDSDDVPNPAVDITEIEWADDDALPFPLCVSSTTDQAHGSRFVPNVSVVHGNVMLADHGRTIKDETLGTMPAPEIFIPAAVGEPCDRSEPVAVPARFRPALDRGPLTQQGRIAAPSPDDPKPAPFDPTEPAARNMQWAMDLVLPPVGLTGKLGTESLEWEPRPDFFSSEPTARHFVAEVDDRGIATIRFGDDDYGAAPLRDTAFTAAYRVGNGAAGNVGAESIAHVFSTDSGIDLVINPLPARGGIDPEATEHARQAAPDAFRVQERAVTEADYAEVTERRRGVDRAAATFRWTGSWYTLFDTVDRTGGLEVDAAYRTDTRQYLERYRVVGNDLEVDAPRFVPLDVAMTVCVKPAFFRGQVEAELLDVFRRFFDPDNFTFGQSLYLSRLYAAAQAVEGVESVSVTRFQRQGNAASDARASGELKMARLEIVRLENNRDFPERGKLELRMRGGR